MKDYMGVTIRKGDKVFYGHSTKTGGVEFQTFIVKGITKSRVEVHDQQRFGRTGKYINPNNCVVVKPVSTVGLTKAVRCKNCVHYLPTQKDMGFCSMSKVAMKPMGFCSYGITEVIRSEQNQPE